MESAEVLRQILLLIDEEVEEVESTGVLILPCVVRAIILRVLVNELILRKDCRLVLMNDHLIDSLCRLRYSCWSHKRRLPVYLFEDSIVD